MNVQQPNSFRTGPDEHGHFGIYGGRLEAETLMPLILDLEQAYADAKADSKCRDEMDGHLATYVGRPSPLYFARRLTDHCGGAKIYFKREELNHTGAHKVNNVLGQIMLALRMGKTRIIAETGAGMHGVATATLCAKFGLPCIVYMGAVDVERQKPNVLRMEILGAEVRAVESGSKTLKDAMNEALRDWVTNVSDTFYCIGTVAGPHPYPAMGPEHAWLKDMGRVQFLSATDDEAVAAFQLCSKLEGIIPALEPAHALARVFDLAPKKPADHLMVVNLSGRGDKDLDSVAAFLESKKR